MSGRIGELVLVLFLVLILFGAGKLPKVMGELGRGLKAFRDGMGGQDSPEEQKEKEKIQKTDQ